MRRLIFALALPLFGCSAGPGVAPRDAYRVAVATNNAAALALDATAIVKRAEVTRAARLGMAACRPQDVGCREQAVREALANGQPAFDKIDLATRVQHDLADTLKTLEACAGDAEKMPDRACEVGMLRAAIDKLPALLEAVRAVKKEAEATSPAAKEVAQ